MKRFAYIFGILAFSLNGFAQIWTKPSPLVVSGVPSEYLINIYDIMLHSSGELWCYFRVRDTARYIYLGYYIAHYDPQEEEWINPVEIIPKEKGIGVEELVEDKKGRIWMIAGSALPYLYGFYYDGHSFSKVVEIQGAPTWNNLKGCCRDNSGNIWVISITDAWRADCGWELSYNWYDGEVWYPAKRLTYSQYGCLMAVPLTDKDGRVWVAWQGNEESCLKYKYPDREEWSDSVCIPGARHPQLACDSEGRIWVVWVSTLLSNPENTDAIYVGYYKDGEWSTPVLISKEVPSQFPMIAVDRRDRVWIVWGSIKSDSYGDIWFAYYDGEEWSEPAPIYKRTRLSDSWPSIIIDGEGRVWCRWIGLHPSRRFTLSYISHTIEMGVEEESRNNAIKPELLANFPNPFETVTSIKWQVAGREPINLEVYDAMGRLVRTFARTQSQEPGAYTVVWEGRDEEGKLLPSGIYFCELRAGGYKAIKKVILVR